MDNDLTDEEYLDYLRLQAEQRGDLTLAKQLDCAKSLFATARSVARLVINHAHERRANDGGRV